MIAPQGHGILRQRADRKAVWGLYCNYVRQANRQYISMTAFYAMAHRLVSAYGYSIEAVIQVVPALYQPLRDYIRDRWNADLESGEVANRPAILPVPGAYRIHPAWWNVTLYEWAPQPFAELINIIANGDHAAIGVDTEFCAYSDRHTRGAARHDWLGISILGRSFLFFRPLDADVAAFFSWIFRETRVMVCVFDGKDDLAGITAPPDQVFDAAIGHGQGYNLHRCALQELNIYLDKSYTHFEWASPALNYYEGSYLALDSMVPLLVWHRANTNVRITDYHPPGHAFPHY